MKPAAPPPFVLIASVMIRGMDEVGKVFAVLCPCPTHDHSADHCLIELSDELRTARFLEAGEPADVVVVPLEWYQRVTGVRDSMPKRTGG
jgi:hypothetical protein